MPEGNARPKLRPVVSRLALGFAAATGESIVEAFAKAFLVAALTGGALAGNYVRAFYLRQWFDKRGRISARNGTDA
jgi:hypothetical protein